MNKGLTNKDENEIKTDIISNNLLLNNEVVYEFNSISNASDNSENKMDKNISSETENSSYFSNFCHLDEDLQKSNYSNFDSSVNHGVSEKVQNLASQIYNELQKIISALNDDDKVVSGLMPLIVNVLESLDLQLLETQQLQVDIELLKDDNFKLNSAFEKEKQIKKKLEKQLLEFEFHSEEEKQKLDRKIISLENIVKMFEIKSKNSSDMVSRLEEEKLELKNEYNKLHHRNTDLLRSYCDLMERIKILVGCEENANINNLNSLDWQFLNKLKKNIELIDPNDKNNTEKPTVSLQENLDENLNVTDKTKIKSNYNLNELMTMEDNQSLNDVSLLDDSNKDYPSLTGQLVNTNEYASTTTDNLFVMEKEIENLISENNELLTTKNALNIVKNDLILQIDDLQSQIALLQQENLQMNKIQEFYKHRVEKLEDELKKNQNQIEQLKAKLNQSMKNFEEGIPLSQRKTFSKCEMARVIMEKNEYKKKFFELQETIKYTDQFKINRTESQERKSSIWKFFSNFFNNTLSSDNTLNEFSNVRYQNSNVDINFNKDLSYRNSNLLPLESMRRRVRLNQNKNLLNKNNLSLNNDNLIFYFDNDLEYEKKKMNRKCQLNKNIVAYGWCLQQNFQENNLKTHPVPVPIHCRPLISTVSSHLSNSTSINSSNHNFNGLRIWCAAAVDLSGGEAGFPQSNSEYCIKKDFEKNINEVTYDSNKDMKQISSEYKLSTFTWICSSSHSKSKITIINMKSNPSEILDTFFIKTHLFCICSVSGAKNSDTNLDIKFDKCDSPIFYKIKLFNDSKQTLDSNKSSFNNQEDKKLLISNEQNIKEDIDVDNRNEKNSAAEKLANYLDYYNYSEKKMDEKTSLKHKNEKYDKKMTTVLPTMWFGGQNGRVYVYSSVAQWSQLINYVDLNDSALKISYSSGKVFVGLANGEMCIFTRDYNNGEWKLHEYYLINLNKISNLYYNNILIDYEEFSANSNKNVIKELLEIEKKKNNLNQNEKSNTNGFSIRCFTIAGKNIWCGFRNLLMIFSIDNLKLLNISAAHSNKEEQVRQLTSISYKEKNSDNEDFILCILRLDCVLRIYQNKKPFDCIYNVDLEPTINKFLICNLSKHKNLELDLKDGTDNKILGLINFIRITSIIVTENRIWLGTANGLILTIPHVLNVDNGKKEPQLILENCQLSFHGHKDAVKFFVAAKNLVLSGGEGYTDFRIESEFDSNITSILSRTDHSFLILWEININ